MSVNNQTIRDSHAIALYLCGMSNSNIIYPEHPLERAKVHEMMFYNSSTLFPIDSTIFVSDYSTYNYRFRYWNDGTVEFGSVNLYLLDNQDFQKWKALTQRI